MHIESTSEWNCKSQLNWFSYLADMASLGSDCFYVWLTCVLLMHAHHWPNQFTVAPRDLAFFTSLSTVYS